MTDSQQLLFGALNSDNKVEALRQAVIALGKAGSEKADLLSQLEVMRSLVSSEVDEDAILDVMDFLTGWCSSHMKIE